MQFLTPLRTEKIGARLVRLTDDVIFLSSRYPGEFVARAGFETNLASIPRGLWNIFPPTGEYDIAAVIHDAAYNQFLRTKDGARIHTVKHVADNLFHEALLACGVGKIKAKMMYLGVKAFGKLDKSRTQLEDEPPKE